MKTNILLFVILFMLNTFNSLWAQAAAPPIDFTPFERPEPLFVFPVDSPSTLLEVISDSLKVFGFQIIRRDFREYELEAKRTIKSKSQDHDKVIVWLERDFSEPYKYIKVFFIYGRFLKIMSHKTNVERIYINAMNQEAYVGKLKEALISIPSQ